MSCILPWLASHRWCWVQVGAILLFVVLFEIGLGPIPWLITAEIFPATVSATVMSAASCLNWVRLD